VLELKESKKERTQPVCDFDFSRGLEVHPALGDSRPGCGAGCEHSCPFSRLRGDAPDASADKQALDSEAASCTTPHVRSSPVSSSEGQQLHEIFQITVWPDYFVDDRDCSSFAQFCCLQNIATVSCYHLHT